ncbi:hypothetical protein Glove_153g13 [Diversispora epigaea]|uniref:Uncharacterized protein n=1 Tax=Diversispora epigaea TaxID=1348612 RepID=A0A397IVA4_9GLOM|nr:hypothetical protein Glove_153g13 [Diversispora epigaea]
MENSNVIPERIELQTENVSSSDISDDTSNSDDTPEQIENISDNTSNSNIQESETQCFTSSISAKTISSEDKEIIEFLESQDKERVSDMIRKRNREKKFRAQDPSLDNNSSDQSNLSCDIKTVPLEGDDQIHVISDAVASSLRETESSFLETEKEKCQEISITNPDDRQKEKYQEISVTNPDDRQKEKCQENEPTNHNIYVTEEPDEIEPTKRQYIEQGLIKELLSSNPIVPPVSSEIIEDRTFQITTQSLVRLFHYAIRSRHEKILAWYYYSDDFENKVIEICRNVKPSTWYYIRKLAYENFKSQENSDVVWVGKDKIRQVSYSTNAISSLTNSQIQNVIKNVTSAEPLLETITNPDDQTIAEASISIESVSTVSKKSPEAEVSVVSEIISPVTSSNTNFSGNDKIADIDFTCSDDEDIIMI